MVLTLVPWVVVGVIAFGAIGFLWWHLLDPAPGDSTIVIPAGTADRIAGGGDSAVTPAEVEVERGARLRIENDDTTPHQLGEWVIMPGETFTLEGDMTSYSLDCTFHPGGILSLSERGRGGLLTTILAPALILGFPVGLLVGVAVTVARRIDVWDEQASH